MHDQEKEIGVEVGAKMMDTRMRDHIIDDLLQKTPRHAYSDSMLFKLGLHTPFDIEKYICNRFFGGKAKIHLRRQKGTVTRRCNRLSSRIMHAVRRTQMKGGKGIYRISNVNFDLQGYVYAESLVEAQRLGEMFLLYSPTTGGSIHTRFVSYSFPKNLTAYNTKFIEFLDKKIGSHEQTIGIAKQKIEKLVSLKSSLLLMQKHILVSEK